MWQQGLDRKLVRKLIKIYAQEDNWHELDYQTGNLGYGWIHYGLIRIIKPDRVLVIGSRYGFIPAVCALACKDNRIGKIDFVDAGYDQSKEPQDKNHWGGIGFWKKTDIKKHFNKLDLSDYINFYLMTSVEFARKNIKRRWGYIYLDGDHSYNGVRSDYRQFWPKLKKKGYLAFHDIYTDKVGGLNYGVKKFWQEKKKSKRYNLIEFPGKYGLGIIHKL